MQMHKNNMGVWEIDDARIIFRNFEGAARGIYDRPGDRNFTLVIPNQEMGEQLINDKGKYGDGYNVKVKAPRDEGDDPFIGLKVKVRFNDYGPNIYLVSGRNKRRITEDEVGLLDKISIQSVDLDIRAYDWTRPNGNHGRTAYLNSMRVYQNVDRFAAEMAEQEHPEDDYPIDDSDLPFEV